MSNKKLSPAEIKTQTNKKIVNLEMIRRSIRTNLRNLITKKKKKEKFLKNSDLSKLNCDEKEKPYLHLNNINLILPYYLDSSEAGFDIPDETERSKIFEESEESCSDRTKQRNYSKRVNINTLLKLLMKAIYKKITTRDSFKQKRMIANLCKNNANEFLNWIKENKNYFKSLSKVCNLSSFLRGKKKMESKNKIFPTILGSIIKYFLHEEAFSYLIYERKCEGREREFLEKMPQLLTEIEILEDQK